MAHQKTIRIIELFGILLVILSLFMPYMQLPVIDSGGNLIVGGFYWKNATLLDFILDSGSGPLIAGFLLGFGLFLLGIRLWGQTWVIAGTTALVLIAVEETHLFPSNLGIGLLVLILGATLCCARLVVRLIDEYLVETDVPMME